MTSEEGEMAHGKGMTGRESTPGGVSIYVYACVYMCVNEMPRSTPLPNTHLHLPQFLPKRWGVHPLHACGPLPSLSFTRTAKYLPCSATHGDDA